MLEKKGFDWIVRLLQILWQVFQILVILYIVLVLVRYFKRNGKK